MRKTHRHTVRRKTKWNNYWQSHIGRIEIRVMEFERMMQIVGKSGGLSWPYPFRDEVDRLKNAVMGATDE